MFQMGKMYLLKSPVHTRAIANIYSTERANAKRQKRQLGFAAGEYLFGKPCDTYEEQHGWRNKTSAQSYGSYLGWN